MCACVCVWVHLNGKYSNDAFMHACVFKNERDREKENTCRLVRVSHSLLAQFNIPHSIPVSSNVPEYNVLTRGIK